MDRAQGSETVPRRFLDSVYDLGDHTATKEFYHEWADTYDDDVSGEGYIPPQRCSEVLARFANDTGQPVLDLGCGTGLCGIALRSAGFRVVDGTDFSNEMIEIARSRNIYRRTFCHDLAEPLPFPAGTVSNTVAAGVISPAHAPPEAIDHAIEALAPGGVLVFSLNDHARKAPAFEGRVHAWVDCGAAVLEHRENGPHLPGIGLEAMVYALRKRA